MKRLWNWRRDSRLSATLVLIAVTEITHIRELWPVLEIVMAESSLGEKVLFFGLLKGAGADPGE